MQTQWTDKRNILIPFLKMWAQSECGKDQEKRPMFTPGINRARMSDTFLLSLTMWILSKNIGASSVMTSVSLNHILVVFHA